jgi:hypothetical protein
LKRKYWKKRLFFRKLFPRLLNKSFFLHKLRKVSLRKRFSLLVSNFKKQKSFYYFFRKIGKNFFKEKFVNLFLKNKNLKIQKNKIFNILFFNSFFFSKKRFLFKSAFSSYDKSLLVKSNSFFNNNDFNSVFETLPLDYNFFNFLNQMNNIKSSFSSGLMHYSFFFFFKNYRQKYFSRQLLMRKFFPFNRIKKLNVQKFLYRSFFRFSSRGFFFKRRHKFFLYDKIYNNRFFFYNKKFFNYFLKN